MDSSRSAQRAVIQFLRTEICRRKKEVYGEQCLARCTIFRRCQRYEAERVNTKDLPALVRRTLLPTMPRFRLCMSSYGRIVGSPHVKLLLNCR
ncbi:hypothetical protein AVEN_176466-1 [Araneus ventricosus]|uniref:DUF4817 domain-containing protein n=1 Tax=Araneus ventricosus TaxID=182803 RepID=A0A4Y2JLM9_ARAVE|nr:hypothetical protein AVEN_176466-1 [Araneus ventricosus]